MPYQIQEPTSITKAVQQVATEIHKFSLWLGNTFASLLDIAFILLIVAAIAIGLILFVITKAKWDMTEAIVKAILRHAESLEKLVEEVRKTREGGTETREEERREFEREFRGELPY